MDTEGLSVICAGLGSVEENDYGDRTGYTKSEYCLDNLKDLLRFLRRDDPQTREVFKQVCKWNTVAKDLIPIIEHCQDDRSVVLNAVKVLVFLTMPIEPASSDITQQMEYLWGLKSSITCSDAIPIVVSLLEKPLENLESEAFTEDDWKLVQLVLTLIRNVLAIQGIPMKTQSATQFLSLRDRFLELLFNENVMDLILILTQHFSGSCGFLSQDSLLLMETFHYIFMGQDPELIAKAYQRGSKVEGDAKDFLTSLRSLMEEDEEKRKLIRLRNMGRHSQFSGTFARLTMDGSKALFKGNPCFVSRDTLAKPQKVHRGPLKRIVWDHGSLPSTKNNILELLHDFVNQFLSAGYNVLMQSVREDIEKEHHAVQNSDIVVFFQVAQFVSSFQYHNLLIPKPNMVTDGVDGSAEKCGDSTMFTGNICGPIAESMNESMFLLVISKWRYAFDGLKETNNYKFLSAAGCLMKVMIRMLDLVLKLSAEGSREPQTARTLLYKLFYDQTDQGMTHFLLNLVKSFNSHKQPKSDLADLIEIIHVVVRLMEALQARGTLRVSRKSRKVRKRKMPSEKNDASDEPFEGHATVKNDIGLSKCDGKDGLSVELNEPNQSSLQTDNSKFDKSNDNFHYGTDSSSDEQLAGIDEVNFKISTLVSAFANNTIIQNLCWLLKFYKSNSTTTNHYIICMLQRICDDLELSPMLYQLSLLNIFCDILAEQKLGPCKEYENIVHFLTTLVRRMLRKIKSQPILFVELLFWKTRKECHSINCDSLLHGLGNLRKESGSLGVVSEKGEIGSPGGIRRSIADALGDDEADFVFNHHIVNQEDKDPNTMNAQNVSLGNNASLNQLDGSFTSISNRDINVQQTSDMFGSETNSKGRKRLILDNELKEKLTSLYEKFKDDQHCSLLIAEAIDPDGNISSQQVSNKLKQLGLIAASKKRMPQSYPLFEGGHNRLKSSDLDSSFSGQPFHRRKRVHAFNEDQEKMIKDLFERFKGHKRCSYMIANALDGDGKIAVAQVSRKLKQLGLSIPRHKRPGGDTHLIDEDLSDASQNPDNATLSSLRKRRRNKVTSRLLSEDVPNKTNDGNPSQDSDDETLISVLKKTRRFFPKPNDEMSIMTPAVVVNDSSNTVTGGVTERDGLEQSSEMEVVDVSKDDNPRHSSSDGIEAESTELNSRNNFGIGRVKNVDHFPDQQLYNELADESADSGDDLSRLAQSPKGPTVMRRKLRLLIDPEDDE